AKTAEKIKEHFSGLLEELRLKRIELNRAETRVHNFVEFIASGRATPALADALAQAERQVNRVRFIWLRVTRGAAGRAADRRRRG
ncbi:MAG TPA: hypothetical protein VJN18_02585, partial [Polyangiaceae bacterium]|nr:hypothetical protein [Polyangiaceae bacterium]